MLLCFTFSKDTDLLEKRKLQGSKKKKKKRPVVVRGWGEGGIYRWAQRIFRAVKPAYTKL